MIEISDDGRQARFDPQRGFIDFPGGGRKFRIRFERQSRRYWALSNYVPARHRSGNPEGVRNTLALLSSPEPQKWEVRSVILYHPDTQTHGFQCADWLTEGNYLIVVARTAYDDEAGGAHNQHDANFVTFHRVGNFRRLIMKDAVESFFQ